MESIKLDLVPGKKMPSLHASQYDDGRTHGIDLYENGVAYKLDGTEKLTINERKVDNNICSMDIENTFVGSSHIVFASFLQMCACAGSNFCELRISKGDVDIGTLNFILEVEPDPTADGIESESEIRNLETQIREITEEVIGDDYYTAEQTDEAIATATEGKADTTYVNEELAKKADKTDTYTKTQVDNALNNKMNKANPTGTGSMSVGSGITMFGSNSQAFGSNHVVGGSNNFVAGVGHSIPYGSNRFVFGSYCNGNVSYDMIEVVGKGTSDSNRSNARTLDKNGNETLAGNLTFNGNKSLTSEISRLDGRIDNLPAPMVFKGTLGTGGTIEVLPVASDYNEGWTYKVITDGTYAGQTAKVGDVFTSNGSAWVYIPSGDEDNDTWRAIKVNGTEKLGSNISSGSVDFVGSENVDVEFDSNGNKVGIKTKNIYTKTEVDGLLDDKADADNTYTKAQVDDIVYNILPDDTASGSVANFNTSLELPIKSLEIDVNAVQESGTPTPATPLPISGWSEINLYQLGGNFFNKNTVTNGKLINGSGNEVSYTDWNISDFIPVVEGASYYLYGLTTHPNTNQDNFELFDENKNKVGYANVKTNEQPYLIPSGVAYIKCCVENTDLNTAQLGVSVNDSYVAYTPTINTVTIALGDTYYGGYVTQDKAGHRQFEVTHGIYTFDGTENFGALSSNNRVYTNVLSDAYIPSVATEKCVISTHYVGVSQSQAANGTVYKTTGNPALVFQDDINGVDVATFKAFLANQYASNTPVTVAYKIATPYVIDLPDGEPINTIAGTNNFFADTGDSTVVFKCSVNDYVSAHSGGNLLGMGGVYLGGAKSGGSEEETDESEDAEKVKLDEPKEEIKEIGDKKKKLGGE